MSHVTDKFNEASIPKAIAKFAIPTILSQLVVLIYNLADTFFVGRTNDPTQVAALTLSFPLFMSLTMVGNLFGIGANSYISRSLGSGNYDKAKQASTFSFYGALTAVLMLILGLGFFMEPILYTVGAKTEATFTATKQYLTWTVIYGGLPTVAALTLGHLIRGEGNVKKASTGMILGGLLNIFLDFIFVELLQMGANGAAIATFLSNTVSMCYLLIHILRSKNSVICLNIGKLSLERKMISDIIFVGLPAAAVIILGSTANIVLTNQMSVYGDISIAAYGIIQKLGNIAIQITVGLTQGIMPLLGFYFGAKKMDKVREVNRYSFLILAIYAVFCVVLLVGCGEFLVRIFMKETTTVVKATEFSKIWALCVPGMCFTNLFCSIFQAMGKWIQSLLLSVVRQAGLLIPFILIFGNIFGEKGLVMAQPFADSVTLIFGICMYVFLERKLKEI